jgi:hypothetical protein
VPAALQQSLLGSFLLPPLCQYFASQPRPLLPLRQLSRGGWLRLAERRSFRLLGLRHLLDHPLDPELARPVTPMTASNGSYPNVLAELYFI